MMKKISLIIGISLIFISCNSFLDTVPRDTLSPVNYYKTESDLNVALAGIYDRLQDVRLYGSGMNTYFSYSDEFFFKNAQSSTYAGFFSASTLELGRAWESLYTGIDRANNLLENIDGADVDDEVKDVIRGQALFLRAYYYYILVDFWGDVPLKLHATKSPLDKPVAQSNKKVIYDQVVEDMKTAAGLVKGITEYGYNSRITKTAVYGILSRVYLKMAGQPLNETDKFVEARAYADSVISAGIHELNPSYKQIFINHSQDIYDIEECIWEVDFNGTGAGVIKESGTLGAVLGISCFDLDTGFCDDATRVYEKLYKTYDADGSDLRRDWCVAPYKFMTENGVTYRRFWDSSYSLYFRNPGKWRREYEFATPKTRAGTPTNYPVLRYADILLMFAEADNEIEPTPSAKAIEYVNMVRRRAYGVTDLNVAHSKDIPTNINKDDFRNEIRIERYKEFPFEGLRRHDLIRWGIYVKTMADLVIEISNTAPTAFKYAATTPSNMTERSVLFPIPNSEIAVNPYIKQNPGW